MYLSNRDRMAVAELVRDASELFESNAKQAEFAGRLALILAEADARFRPLRFVYWCRPWSVRNTKAEYAWNREEARVREWVARNPPAPSLPSEFPG